MKDFNKGEHGLMAYDFITDGQLGCHICDMEFTSFYFLNRHMNVHNSLTCEICGSGFTNQHRLKSHVQNHEKGSYKCEQCQNVFPTKVKLLYHISRNHKEVIKKSLNHRCPHCLEKFPTHYKKVTHMKDVHGITFKFECKTCGAIYPRRVNLTKHITKVHLQNLKCEICGKCFGNRVQLKIHMKGHTRDVDFVCATCHKSYKQDNKLRAHILKQHGYKSACVKCGVGFMENANLIVHRKGGHLLTKIST